MTIKKKKTKKILEAPPFFLVYFGKPHSGKTYDLHRFLTHRKRDTVFVYNSGRDSDWPNYEEIELLTGDKGKTLLFNYKGEDYDFKECFMDMFKGKKVKAMESDDEAAETLLYKSLKIKGLFRGLFFVIDDATNLFESRVSKSQKACFYRAKHVGVRFALIFHDPAMFPNALWGALTLAKFFHNNVEPPYEKKRKIPHFNKVLEAHEFLQDAPDYSSCTLEMHTGKLTLLPYEK